VRCNEISVIPSSWIEAVSWYAVSIDQKLLEIPPDVVGIHVIIPQQRLVPDVPSCWWTSILEKLIQWMGGGSVDFNFGIYGHIRMRYVTVSRSNIQQAIYNFIRSNGWLQPHELITRKS